MFGDVVDGIKREELFSQAAASARKRSHLLLHGGHDDQVQRLLIAGQPGTYVRPHKHSVQWEMLAVLEGQLDLLLLDDAGTVLRRHVLCRSSPLVHIPQAVSHTCVVQRPRTLVLEVKPGPYRDNEFAEWAPVEGSREAEELLSRMATARQRDALFNGRSA